MSTQCSPKTLLHSSLPCRFVPPPRVTSAPLTVSLAVLQTMEILCDLVCVLHEHKREFQDDTLMKTHYCTLSLKDTEVN